MEQVSNHARVQFAEALIDQMPQGVLMISSDRLIYFANEAAKTMLAGRKLIFAIDDKLAVGRRTEDLKQLLASTKPGTRTMVLINDDGDFACLSIVPLAGPESYFAVHVAAHRESTGVDEELISGLYDLTPMEARVSVLVAQGHKPNAIARRLGTSIFTVRSHLAKAFSKTATSGQTALGGLINGLTPMARVAA